MQTKDALAVSWSGYKTPGGWVKAPKYIQKCQSFVGWPRATNWLIIPISFSHVLAIVIKFKTSDFFSCHLSSHFYILLSYSSCHSHQGQNVTRRDKDLLNVLFTWIGLLGVVGAEPCLTDTRVPRVCWQHVQSPNRAQRPWPQVAILYGSLTPHQQQLPVVSQVQARCNRSMVRIETSL